MKSKILYVVGGLLVVVVLGVLVNVANNVGTLDEKVNFLAAGSGEQMVGGTTNFDALSLGGNLAVGGTFAATGATTFSDNLTVSGTLYPGSFPTMDGTTTTLTTAMSGYTFLLGGADATFTLPATTTDAGIYYRFVVSEALSANNLIVTSDGGNDIEGTLIVAGAVVDCAAEDTITFVADGENIGDYVELYNDGINWLIGDSGALTASKLTCSAN